MARHGMNRRHTTVWLGPIVGAALAASTLLTAAAAGAAGPAEPGHRVNVTKYGFSLVLPPGWNQVNLTGSQVGSIVGSARGYANLKTVLTQQAENASVKGLRFYAVATDQANGTFVPVMNVGIFKGSGTQAVLNPEIKGFLSEEGAKSVQVKNVSLRFGKAVEGTYELVPTSSSSPTVWETQVYAAHNGQIYVATFSALTKPAVELTAAVVMASWRFIKKS